MRRIVELYREVAREVVALIFGPGESIRDLQLQRR